MLKIIINGKERLFDKRSGEVFVDGNAIVADIICIGPNSYHLLLDQKSYNIELLERDDKGKNQIIMINGMKQVVEIKDKYDELLEQLGLDKVKGNKVNVVKAPMPGLVLKIMA